MYKKPIVEVHSTFLDKETLLKNKSYPGFEYYKFTCPKLDFQGVATVDDYDEFLEDLPYRILNHVRLYQNDDSECERIAFYAKSSGDIVIDLIKIRDE